MGLTKKFANMLINNIILKPFGLRLSHRKGKNVFDDIKRLLAKSEVRCIIDGGAHRGDFSIKAISIFPKATSYSFEPQKNIYDLLLKTISNNLHIKTFRYALGARTGKAQFYTNTYSLSSALSPTSLEGLKYFKEYNQPRNTEEVDVITLKDFTTKEKITSIDLCKLDLQGYELEALRGLGNVINSVKLIYLEINFIRTYETCCLFSEIDQYLQKHNFYLYGLYDLVTSPIDGRLLFGDAIFLNSQFISL